RDWLPAWQGLRSRHLDTATTLAGGTGDPALDSALAADLDALRSELDAVARGDASEARLSAVHGMGELLSSRLVQVALGDGWERLDTRDVLVVHPGEMGMGVDWAQSRERLVNWRASH